ncbi:MAG: endonuclease [Acidobacteria bacterium]|nr:endonuclease [Acidobacteriota bacterium]
MPSYWRLKREKIQVRRRVVAGLEAIREQIRTTLPEQTTDRSLILGTLNTRDFDDNKFGHGPRLPESFYYLAEIIAAFDVIAIQELNRGLGPLERLMRVLGPDYRYLVTDVTEGRAGNTERLGMIYNRRKVTFTGVAGEVVLPDRLRMSESTKKGQFSRTPFAASFRSGWFNFVLATVHIYYGESSKKSAAYARRVKEIESVARFLAKRAKDEDANYVLVGDFNIDKFEDKTYDALDKFGFEVFRNKVGSNRKQNKFYDQISFRTRPGELRLADGDRAHGVLNFFESVFRDDQFETYDAEVIKTLERRKVALQEEKAATTSAKKIAKADKGIAKIESQLGNAEERRWYYEGEWRTFQMSDHYPLWVELDIDFTQDYLETLK